jgi:DNA repair protein RecO (recombination protein O)
MSQHVKSRALILKSIKWRDSSRIVTLFSEKAGKIKVIAHGAAREKSSFRGKIETLNLIEAVLSLSESRSLQILTDVHLMDDFRGIKSDFQRIVYGFSMFEVLDHVFEEGDPDPVFFQFIITLLKNCTESPAPKLIWWYFLLKLASYLGFKPAFDRCAGCGRSDAGSFVFVFRDGGIYCPACQPGPGPIRLLNQQQVSFLKDLQSTNYKKIGMDTNTGTPAYDFTGFLLDYLNEHIGHPLQIQSLDILKQSNDLSLKQGH